MIDTQLKLEAKIPNGSKVSAFHKELHKKFSSKANMTLKVRVASFQKHQRYLDDQ